MQAIGIVSASSPRSAAAVLRFRSSVSKVVSTESIKSYQTDMLYLGKVFYSQLGFRVSYSCAILTPKRKSKRMDVEKTIQFLLEQQARFDARQAELVERFAEFGLRSHERMVQIEDALLDVATSQTKTNAILVTLAERHLELEQSHWALSDDHETTRQNLKAISEAQKITTQHLSALITRFDRHTADHV